MSERADLPVGPPARILIVDDEPLNVDYLEQELECHGFEIETAASGTAALERVAASPPDLVLLDVMMPGMDGMSVLRILKADPETRLVPVVLMTALNSVDDRVRGIEAGADDFLSKPVDDRELLARINTSLSLKRAIDRTVDELRSTSAHLERYGGRRVRDVAVLAIDWRMRDTTLPDEAVAFVVRRNRTAAEECIGALGGLSSEAEDSPLVAVFDGPDDRARALAALDAARAILDQASTIGTSPEVRPSAAVSLGRAQVGSTRLTIEGAPHWVFGVAGEPVDHASTLARAASEADVLVADDVAAAVHDRYTLAPVGDRAFRVLAVTAVTDEADAPPARLDRRIRTILITDVVGSTQTVERLGDRAWGEIVAEHERVTRAELTLFGGDELDTTGDGFVVAFDGAAPAVRCALALLERVAELGLTIRAGIHTGEVESVGGRVRGIALHIASRIAARASPGEILVSATTRELTAGAGLTLTDRGEHVLRGVSDPRRLYAAADSSALRRGGASQPASLGSGYPARLTAREVDVLRLVAVGLSDAEVAERLVVSTRTVNAHLRSVYRKIGVHSRAAAGRFAEENYLL